MSSLPTAPSRQASTDSLFAGVLVLLTLLVVVLWKRAFHFHTEDMDHAFVPWLLHLEQVGRLRGLEGSYASYAPPYLYVLSLFSWLSAWFSPASVVRLINIFVLLVTAGLGYSIVRTLGCTVRRSALAAGLLLVAPEVFANGIVWGQADILPTVFLLLFFRLMLARQPAWGMVSLGVALSIKLQAIFMGPAVLAMLLLGEIPLWTLLLIPASYLLVLVPAVLAGRPWRQAAWVYADQYGAFQSISMNAANPWRLLVPWSRHSEQLTNQLNLIALGAGLLATVALVVFFTRLRPRLGGLRLLAAMALSLLVEPFVLPKMHERYFFFGDTLMLLLAAACPRMWALPAALLQIAAIMAYTPYLVRPEGTGFFAVAVLLVLVAILLVVHSLLPGQAHAVVSEETAGDPTPARA